MSQLDVSFSYSPLAMALAHEFQKIVDSLPADWSDLDMDLRIDDLGRYIEASVFMSQCNARPYDGGEWQWRIAVANNFGHAASAGTVSASLSLLDSNGIDGELLLHDLREGRSEVVQMWGRPESVREEFRQRRAI